MTIRRKWILTGSALALAAGIGTYAFTASSQEHEHRFGSQSAPHMGPGMMGPGMMGPGMMGRGMMDRGMRPGAGGNRGMGPGNTGMGHDSAMMGDMRLIHELLANHNRITRTVTKLADGIRTLTESDDPRLAQIIKDHVAAMGQRMRTGQPMGLPIESEALRAMYRNKDKIKTTVEMTAKGVIVAQTSTDPGTVEVLQTHAAEVTALVNGDMQALHTAMMRNVPMMHGRMGGGMMPGRHDHGAAPGAR